MKAVVVKHNKLRSIIRFNNDEHLEKFYQKVVKIGFEAHIVDCNKATPPPEDYKPRSNKRIMWCPYCATKRRFKKHNSYRKCEICGISDGDFYVRIYNKLDGGKRGKSKNANNRRTRQQRKKFTS